MLYDSGDWKMGSTDRSIMVVNHTPQIADNLKTLIEFMDAPQVRTARPETWQAELGDSRLEAMFVGADLSTDEVDDVVSAVGRLDPNVPIVMLDPVEIQKD